MGSSWRPEWGTPRPLPPTHELESQPGPAARALRDMLGPGGQPGDLSIAQRGGSVQIPPWYAQKYQSSVDWSAKAANFAAAASSSTTPAGFTFTCPLNTKAVIKQITVTVQNILAASTITWAMKRSQGPFPGFDDQLIAPCSASAIIIPYNDVDLRFEQGDKISFTLTESGGNAYTCSVSASGWYTPTADIDRLQSGITI